MLNDECSMNNDSKGKWFFVNKQEKHQEMYS